jgi:hypothetical protein
MADNSKVMKLTGFNGIFGLPPRSHVSDTAILNSMPVVEIIPGVANFESGLTLFRVDTGPGIEKYASILKRHGFRLPTKGLKLAFIADNFPTDSFTNEYGETFLQKFTDVASQGMQQLAQITNSQTGTEGAEKIAGGMKTAFEDVEGGMGAAIQGTANAAIKAAQGMERMIQNMGDRSAFLGGALNTVNKMLAGNRVDFPMIWRNSGFTPSYTATVRLYNPNPGNKLSTKRHILGPIAAILSLTLPQSHDGKTFKWPFFLRVKSAGIYKLDPAVITNVTIVKGGDQQQISFNQQLAMVDVRIDFTSLYSTMVVETTTNFQSDRPTLRNYLHGMEDIKGVQSFTRNEMRNSAKTFAGASDGPNIKISALSPVQNPAAKNTRDSLSAKNEAARRRQAPTVLEKEVGNRVSTEVAAVEGALTEESNPDFITTN